MERPCPSRLAPCRRDGGDWRGTPRRGPRRFSADLAWWTACVRCAVCRAPLGGPWSVVRGPWSVVGGRWSVVRGAGFGWRGLLGCVRALGRLPGTSGWPVAGGPRPVVRSPWPVARSPWRGLRLTWPVGLFTCAEGIRGASPRGSAAVRVAWLLGCRRVGGTGVAFPPGPQGPRLTGRWVARVLGGIRLGTPARPAAGCGSPGARCTPAGGIRRGTPAWRPASRPDAALSSGPAGVRLTWLLSLPRWGRGRGAPAWSDAGFGRPARLPPAAGWWARGDRRAGPCVARPAPAGRNHPVPPVATASGARPAGRTTLDRLV